MPFRGKLSKELKIAQIYPLLRARDIKIYYVFSFGEHLHFCQCNKVDIFIAQYFLNQYS